MQLIFLVGVAGALGAIARYLLSGLFTAMFGAAFPWGIFIVNALGCLMFGLAVGMAEHFSLISDTVRLVLLTGFMGSFTTFSTFIFDAGIMFSQGRWMVSLLDLVGQVVVGLFCLWVGMRLVALMH